MNARKRIVTLLCCIILLLLCACNIHSDGTDLQQILDDLDTELPILLPTLSDENNSLVSSISPNEEHIEQPSILSSTAPYAVGSLEEAAWLYARFLRSEIPGYHKNGNAQWLGDYGFRCVDDNSLDSYTVRDLTDDGIPELYIGYGAEIWTIENSRVINLISRTHSWWTLLPIGAMCYYRPGSGHAEFYYEAISAKSKRYPDITLSVKDLDNDGEMDFFMINGEEVSKETWDDISSDYFSLRNAEPEEDEIPVVFSEWITSLADFELPPKTSIAATVVSGDESYSIVATDFGSPVTPDRAYTLIFHDRNGLPVQTVGYGRNYPNPHYVSDSILQVSYHAGSGLIYVWFYDTVSGTLSPELIDNLIVLDRTLVYFSYDLSLSKVVLKVSDMFNPELYTEIIEPDIPPSSPHYDALLDATIEGRRLYITYLGGEYSELIQLGFELGNSLPEWQTDYYDYVSNTYLDWVSLVDFNMDGLPELCETPGSRSYARIRDVFLRTDSGLSVFSIWAADLYRLTDKSSGENRWLVFSATRVGSPYYRITYSLCDFSDLSTPQANERLMLEYSADATGYVNIAVSVDEMQLTLSDDDLLSLMELYSSTETLSLNSSYEQALWSEFDAKYDIEKIQVDNIFIGNLYSAYGDGFRLAFAQFIAKLNGQGAW